MKNGLIVDRDGTQEWYLDDQLHRENDLPAIITANGSQRWWRHGLKHRENDLPAIIRADGYQRWWINGECHRENGPAIIWANGSQSWCLNGNQIDVEKWIKDNDITTSWESWDETTWSLFRLEFL